MNHTPNLKFKNNEKIDLQEHHDKAKLKRKVD